MINPVTAEQMQRDYLTALYNMGCVVFTGGQNATIRERGIAFAEERNIFASDFFGTTKKWNVAHPRQEFWATLRPEYSFPQIGQEFGKDHSTIQSGVNAFNRRSAQ